VARDYRAEYRARQERARSRGFRSYSAERQARQRIQAVNLHPGSNFELRVPEPEGPKGLQGPFGPTPDPQWDYYWPTRTIDPLRPRTLQARYSDRFNRLEVIFRDGTPWHYDEIPANLWNSFKRAESPGRFINAVLNDFPYGHGGWGSIVGEGE
jgi:KTSC domain